MIVWPYQEPRPSCQVQESTENSRSKKNILCTVVVCSSHYLFMYSCTVYKVCSWWLLECRCFILLNTSSLGYSITHLTCTWNRYLTWVRFISAGQGRICSNSEEDITDPEDGWCKFHCVAVGIRTGFQVWWEESPPLVKHKFPATSFTGLGFPVFQNSYTWPMKFNRKSMSGSEFLSSLIAQHLTSKIFSSALLKLVNYLIFSQAVSIFMSKSARYLYLRNEHVFLTL